MAHKDLEAPFGISNRDVVAWRRNVVHRSRYAVVSAVRHHQGAGNGQARLRTPNHAVSAQGLFGLRAEAEALSGRTVCILGLRGDCAASGERCGTRPFATRPQPPGLRLPTRTLRPIAFRPDYSPGAAARFPPAARCEGAYDPRTRAALFYLP